MKALTNKLIESRLGLRSYGNFVSVNGILYPLPLVNGNEKLGLTVWHGSTVPGNGIVTAAFTDKKEYDFVSSVFFADIHIATKIIGHYQEK